MPKIDKLLATARHKSKIDAERREHEELQQVLDRMTTEQLKELVYDDPSNDRVKEIFESVGGLHLLESR